MSHPKKGLHDHAHPLGPLDFFAPNLSVNFFLGGARPSPPGVVAVGEGAALDAALPDHLETERGMLAGLSAAEQQQLADLLRRFLVALGRVPQES